MTRRLGNEVPRFPEAVGPRSIATSEYTDADRYRRELDAVLGRAWLAVAHVDELAEPNSYVTWDRVDESVVVARTDEGYHAFHNVCRHRGMRLAEGSGVAPRGRLACRWHAWTYRLDGELLTVTEPDTFDGEPWCADPPPTIACDVYAGFVWINLAGDDAEDLRSYLGEVADDLDRSTIASQRYHDRRTVELPVNWKCAIDSFLEAYHVRYLHKETVGLSLETPGVRYHLLGRHSLLTQPYASRYDDIDPDGEIDHFRVADNQYLAFPATTIDVVGGHALVITYLPVDIDRTVLDIWQVYLDKPGAAERQDRYFEAFLEIIEEDLEVLTALSTVTRSRAYRTNHLSLKECRVSHFHEQVNLALAEADRR